MAYVTNGVLVAVIGEVKLVLSGSGNGSVGLDVSGAVITGHLTPSGQTSTPSVARTGREPLVDELAQRAVRAVDASPQGVYCVDIKEDAAGTPRVTEINAGRFFTTSNFFAHAGLNMPDMLVRCALGEHPEHRGSSPLEPDLYWIRMVDMGYRLVAGDELDRWPRAPR